MFVGATLDKPDKEATIACVCHVLSAHLAAAEAQPPSARESRSKDGDYKVFYEDSYKRTPSSTQLEAFYKDVFSRGQMEIECIVTSLIYVERLLKAARGKIRLRAGNWRPVLLSCMIMASKVCDDLSMWNADFGHICAGVHFTQNQRARGGSLKSLRLQRHGRRERVRQILFSPAEHGVAAPDRERGAAPGRQGRDEAERAVVVVVFV